MKRITIGLRALTGSVGIFISQPGFDVDVCSQDQMLFASDQWMYQPIQSGWTSVAYDTITSTPVISALASRSRVHAVLSGLFLNGSGSATIVGLLDDPNIGCFVSGGQISFQANNADSAGIWPTGTTLWIGWTIFRGLY